MTCPTHLIDDVPPAEDQLAFDGEGAHDRVARAIADLILSPEAGGKLIGLEGRWGSGKSTVVNLMRKRVDSADTTTFVFDAWAHERDPLRRSFLESLIGHFQEKRWVERRPWNNVLRKLAKRRKQTKTRTVSDTTPFGKWLALSAVFVPLGTAIVAGSFQHGMTFGVGLAPHGWFWFGALLSSAPLWVIVVKLCLIYSSRREGKEVDLPSELAVLTGNVNSTTTQDTSETPDPTSLEFEAEFRALMSAALLGSESRRAVLVLDNLDRVSPGDALSIWSTLQTFLQDRGSHAAAWFSRIWIVVPYDKTGLRRVWAAQSAVSADGSESVLNDVAESFIDKSFQIRFEVPPPVLSNWKRYLGQLVAEALPRHKNEAHDIYRVFNHQVANQGSPTPRELKLYVNQIGALHRQWGDEFPVSHLAYYSALQRDHKTHEEIRDQLVRGHIPSQFLTAVLRGDLSGNLAGLLFNVQARVGKQLLLSDPIQKALVEKKADMLQELARTHQAGFRVVLDEVVESGLRDMGPNAICVAMQCLRDSGLLASDDDRDVQTTMRVCADAVQNIDSWSPLTEQTATGLAAACILIGDAEFSDKVMDALRETLEKEARDGAETLPAREALITGLTDLAVRLRDLGHVQALSVPFTLRAEPDEWLVTCEQIAKQDRWSWRLFRPQTSFTEIAVYIRHLVENGQVSGALLSTMEVAQSSGFADSWDVIVTALEERLDANQGVEATEGTLLLRALNVAKQDESTEAQDACARLASAGHLLHLLYQARQESHSACTAWCLAMFLPVHPNAEISDAIGNSTDGQAELERILDTDDPGLATEFIKILTVHEELGLLLSIFDASDEYLAFVVRCLRQIADSPDVPWPYTLDETIDRWAYLHECLPEEAEQRRFLRLIETLCADTTLVVRLRERGFHANDAGLYLAVLKTDPDPNFAAFCRAGLEALGSAEWTSGLREQGETLSLLTTLQTSGVAVLLKQPYQDALIKYAKDLLEGGSEPSQEVVSKRALVVSPLSTGPRQVLRTRLRDAAIERDGECADGFFHVFGDELAKSRLRDGTDIVAKLFSGLVRERAVGGLGWLHSVLKAQPDLARKVLGQGCGDGLQATDPRRGFEAERGA